ncbi:MAG: peptidylprolyl isomerase [Bryobacteraceae bacterium]
MRLLIAIALPLCAQVPVVIETEFGEIEAVIDDRNAPITAANFLKYVDAGHYAGGQFHRTVRTAPDNQPQAAVEIDVVQAGVKWMGRFPCRALRRTRRPAGS